MSFLIKYLFKLRNEKYIILILFFFHNVYTIFMTNIINNMFILIKCILYIFIMRKYELLIICFIFQLNKNECKLI